MWSSTPSLWTEGTDRNGHGDTRLGSSGLKVSRITLGCMSFGDTSRGFNQWALNDEQAEPVFRQAVELGITFWDTVNAPPSASTTADSSSAASPTNSASPAQ
jgi:hypothetical protein